MVRKKSNNDNIKQIESKIFEDNVTTKKDLGIIETEFEDKCNNAHEFLDQYMTLNDEINNEIDEFEILEE